ncbi:unnamed protein product, partial [Caenorhabditis brenneri]
NRDICTNFPYYNAKKSSGWQSSVRHNLPKVRSEDGKGNYWEMTEKIGADVYIEEKCGKLHRIKKSLLLQYHPIRRQVAPL